MKTQNEVKQYALAAADWLYVWGANGEVLTQALINRLLRDYGSASYTQSYYQAKLDAGAGRRAADCSGFLMPLSGYDDTAQGYYNACMAKDTIGTLPRDRVCLVFKRNASGRMYHVGIYLGDGMVAEMASSAANYQHKPLSGGGWTHWGSLSGSTMQMPWIPISASWTCLCLCHPWSVAIGVATCGPCRYFWQREGMTRAA